MSIEYAFHIKRLIDVKVCDLAVAHNDNTVADTLVKERNRLVTHLAGNNSVADSRSAAALNVTENRGSCFDPETLLASGEVPVYVDRYEPKYAYVDVDAELPEVHVY